MNPLLRFLLTTAVAFISAWNLSAGDIRVMAWNLEDMDFFDGQGTSRLSDQAVATAAIAAQIQSVNPDICFIAEAPSLIELEYFVHRNNLDYGVIHVRQQSGRRDFADGMAILYRIPPQAVSLNTPGVPGSSRSDRTAYLDWSYRGLLVADFPGFTVIGVHLKSPWDGKERSYDIRDAQAKGLLDFIGPLEKPLVILGDFNDSPGRDEKESAYDLADTLSLLESGLLRAQGDDATHEKGLNLDHIFVRDALVGARHVEETDWDLSDHRPVWADISF